MQFTPDSVALILSGAKTQTRRPVKEREYCSCEGRDGIWGPEDRPMDAPIERVCVGYVADRDKWLLGRTYAVCPGRGKRSVARIRITGIRCERVNQISEEDARAEGIRRENDSPVGPWVYGDKQLGCMAVPATTAYLTLWRSLYPKSDCTELAWVLTFEVVP